MFFSALVLRTHSQRMHAVTVFSPLHNRAPPSCMVSTYGQFPIIGKGTPCGARTTARPVNQTCGGVVPPAHEPCAQISMPFPFPHHDVRVGSHQQQHNHLGGARKAGEEV
eukprot:TRINITY_DN60887_c0_g1_i6.p1 TRINITY_DN60887_c0_g1~~TRINITY_DN60887_c0_g1_i6.p1  ORF type:complete len:110 (+),score=0.05 TRINITY_DN60887_c0_g1_i6:734-1063(+)